MDPPSRVRPRQRPQHHDRTTARPRARTSTTTRTRPAGSGAAGSRAGAIRTVTGARSGSIEVRYLVVTSFRCRPAASQTSKPWGAGSRPRLVVSGAAAREPHQRAVAPAWAYSGIASSTSRSWAGAAGLASRTLT